MSKKGQGQKGSFGEIQLPVSKKYLVPHSRKRMVQIGGIAILVFLSFALFNFFGQEGSMASRGPISSGHAKISGDCQACHTEFGTVTNEKCSTCHEKYGDPLGVYTFATHYLYHSNDSKRLTAAKTHAANETPCSACHKEHGGREAKMTTVTDQYCVTCHAFKSFNKSHPQFDSVMAPAVGTLTAGVTSSTQEETGLRFTHIRHVEEVVKLKKLVDVEKACLHCHNAQSDGKNFEPIAFDQHCDACHLTTTTKTPNLPIAGGVPPRQGDAPGVETLEMLQQRNAPGTLWAFYTNPNEFRVSGNSVLKSPIYHKDPWIMENLRTLRKTLYADAGFADLLETSASGGTDNTLILYDEAIQTLKDRALSLRSTPSREIQSELQEVDNLLRQVQRKVKDPTTPLDKEKFMTPLRQKSMSKEEIEEIKRIIKNLTKPCVDCHIVQDATIKRVQKDQRVLTRAHFDHRAHILQRRCLDCHSEIPFSVTEKVEGVTTPAAVTTTTKVIDQAEILNIPKIETCKECHNPKMTSNRCVTCHDFHANKTNRSDMLLYMD